MIFDLQALFSDKQAVTATANSTNTLDTLAGQAAQAYPWYTGPSAAAVYPIHDSGRGTPLTILVHVDETFLTLTDLTVSLISSAAANLSSPTTLQSTAAIAAATLVAGYQFRLMAFPVGTTQRYLGLTYTVGGSSATAGKITAGIVFDRDTNYLPL